MAARAGLHLAEANDSAEILAHVGPLLEAGRSVMLQPYLESVDREGETALMYIDGRFRTGSSPSSTVMSFAV